MGEGVYLLLVEDEALIQIVAEEALVNGGYAVVCAHSGSEAISALDGDQNHFSGLITDIRLGIGPTGWDVAKRAREIDPCIAVVYATGDSAADWAANGVPNSIVLQKPFAHAQLVAAITGLMNDAAQITAPPSDE